MLFAEALTGATIVFRRAWTTGLEGDSGTPRLFKTVGRKADCDLPAEARADKSPEGDDSISPLDSLEKDRVNGVLVWAEVDRLGGSLSVECWIPKPMLTPEGYADRLCCWARPDGIGIDFLNGDLRRGRRGSGSSTSVSVSRSSSTFSMSDRQGDRDFGATVTRRLGRFFLVDAIRRGIKLARGERGGLFMSGEWSSLDVDRNEGVRALRSWCKGDECRVAGDMECSVLSTKGDKPGLGRAVFVDICRESSIAIPISKCGRLGVAGTSYSWSSSSASVSPQIVMMFGRE